MYKEVLHVDKEIKTTIRKMGKKPELSFMEMKTQIGNKHVKRCLVIREMPIKTTVK